MAREKKAPQAFEEGAPLLIPLQPVESSQIRAVGYDATSRTLAVVFRHGAGALYHYPNVDQETAECFEAAESLGTFFDRHIKQLPFKKYLPEYAVDAATFELTAGELKRVEDSPCA